MMGAGSALPVNPPTQRRGRANFLVGALTLAPPAGVSTRATDPRPVVLTAGLRARTAALGDPSAQLIEREVEGQHVDRLLAQDSERSALRVRGHEPQHLIDG